MKLIVKNKLNNIVEILIFGIPILRYTKNKKYLLSRIKIFPKSLKNEILDDIIKEYGYNKHFYFIRSGIGELYLLNCYYDAFIKNTNCMFLSRRKTHQSLFNLFNKKNIQILDIDANSYKLLTDRKIYKYKGYTFETYLPRQNIVKMLKKFKTPKSNFFKELTNYLGVRDKKNISILSPRYNEFDKYDLKNFIFITTEAISVINLKKEEWQKIIDCLSLKFSVVINDNIQNFCNVKCFNLNLEDSFYLANRAKCIIGLRSGFTELLSVIPIQKYIIYTPLKEGLLSNIQMYKAYTLSNYPNVKRDTLNEFINFDDFYNAVKALVKQDEGI